MDFKELRRGEPWMRADERRLIRRWSRHIQESFAQADIPESSLLVLRVQDVFVSFLLVRRIEEHLQAPAAPADDPKAIAALAESVGKARERMRKAMKELEDACVKIGTPIGRGLADTVRPLMLQTQGVDAQLAEMSDDAEE